MDVAQVILFAVAIPLKQAKPLKHNKTPNNISKKKQEIYQKKQFSEGLGGGSLLSEEAGISL